MGRDRCRGRDGGTEPHGDKQKQSYVAVGNYVCIRTDAGQYHYYCHLASRAVCAGRTVRAGEKLGVMGNTGYSFGAHLHFGGARRGRKKQLFARNPCWESRMRPAPIRCRRKRSLKRIWRRFLQCGVINSPDYWKKDGSGSEILAGTNTQYGGGFAKWRMRKTWNSRGCLLRGKSRSARVQDRAVCTKSVILCRTRNLCCRCPNLKSL